MVTPIPPPLEIPRGFDIPTPTLELPRYKHPKWEPIPIKQNDVKAIRESKAKEKQDDLIQYDKRTKATISQRQRNLLVEHIGDIRKAVDKVASLKKLDLVINSSETQLGVFYVKPTLDVTSDVIAALNASAKKK